MFTEFLVQLWKYENGFLLAFAIKKGNTALKHKRKGCGLERIDFLKQQLIRSLFFTRGR